jgi:hypothetical protein
VPIASDPNSVGEWSAFAALVLVFFGLVAFLFRQSHRRTVARRAEAEAKLSVIPPEYRLRAEPNWFFALALILALCSEVLAATAWGKVGALVALCAVAGPFRIVQVLNQRDQRQVVIAGVTERAARMPTDALRRLVKALESEWGEIEMRPLRELLPPDPDSA